MAATTEAPPEGCHHYEDVGEVPWHIQKYWHQRHSMFSKYDDGIWMTDDAWFGITPEPVANKIAKHVADAAPPTKTILIDAFAGAGGNTIAFARSGRWDRIFAIEKDPKVLKCARHNAAVYGVDKRIWWIEGDCFDVIKKRLKGVGIESVIFASPPWGGPSYNTEALFDLATMAPYNLASLHEGFAKVTKSIILYLPRTSDLNQLAAYASNDKLPVCHYCMKGASKALCVYLGGLSLNV